MNDSDQTNESEEGESSEDDSGISPRPEGAPEGAPDGANDPSLEGANLEGEHEGADNPYPDGASPTRTRRPNPRCVGSHWTTMARCQTQKVKAGTVNNAFIQSLDWSVTIQSLSNEFTAFKTATDKFVNHLTNEIGWLNPFALTAKSNNPRWHEAINGPDRA